MNDKPTKIINDYASLLCTPIKICSKYLGNWGNEYFILFFLL